MKISSLFIFLIFLTSCLPMMNHPDFSITLINDYHESVQVHNSKGKLLAELSPNESKPIEVNRGIIISSKDISIEIDHQKSIKKDIKLHGKSELILTREFKLRQGKVMVPIHSYRKSE